VGYLCSLEIDQLRGFIGEWFHFAQWRRGREGTFLRPARILRNAKPAPVEPGEPLCNQCINKRPDMIARFVGYAFSKVGDLIEEIIYAVLPVDEFPEVDAGRTQPKTMTGVTVEENGPFVKLLPEPDERAGYGFFTTLHRSASLFSLGIAHTEQHP
jgi:hypothetical protein